MAEIEEELKSLLIKVKEESEKVGLKHFIPFSFCSSDLIISNDLSLSLLVLMIDQVLLNPSGEISVQLLYSSAQ